MNTSDLVYRREDYDGEIFRVDFDCDKIQVDCVFFKLNGITDLTRGT